MIGRSEKIPICRFTADNAGAIQSLVAVGHALPPFSRQTDTKYRFFNAILGGIPTSRINQNLREDKRWTYGARSGIASYSAGDQHVVVRTRVQTDKTIESMRELKREIVEFASTRPMTENEYNTHITKTVRSNPISFSSPARVLSSIKYADRHNLEFDYAASEAQRVQSSKREDVVKAAQEVLNPETLLWVIVGDLDAVEDDVRSLNYGDVEIWDVWGDPLDR